MKSNLIAILALSVSLSACDWKGEQASNPVVTQAQAKIGSFETRGPDAAEADERDYADIVFLIKNCPHYKRPVEYMMRDNILTNYEAKLLYLAVKTADKKQDVYASRHNYYEARKAIDPTFKAPSQPLPCNVYLAGSASRASRIVFSRNDGS